MTIVQVRERQLSDADLLVLVRRVMAAVDRSRTAILVNDRTDVALAAGSNGVHLRGDAMPASRVRRVVPQAFLIGRSVHSLREAKEAEDEGGVDYLIFGTVFPSSGKPEGHPVAGIEALTEVCANVRVPVLGIGGITVERVADVAASGSAGVAGIGMFVAADRAGASGMSDLLRQARRAFDTR